MSLVRMIRNLKDAGLIANADSHAERMDVYHPGYSVMYRNMALLMGTIINDHGYVVSCARWPSSSTDPQSDPPPCPTEQCWNEATRCQMCRTLIAKASWPLMLAPGHNPCTLGPSPAILMINSVDGSLLSIVEQRNIMIAYRDGRFTDNDLAERWNYAEENFHDRIALFNPDGIRRFNTRGPTAPGNLLRSLGFAPGAPFPAS